MNMQDVNSLPDLVGYSFLKVQYVTGSLSYLSNRGCKASLRSTRVAQQTSTWMLPDASFCCAGFLPTMTKRNPWLFSADVDHIAISTGPALRTLDKQELNTHWQESLQALLANALIELASMLNSIICHPFCGVLQTAFPKHASILDQGVVFQAEHRGPDPLRCPQPCDQIVQPSATDNGKLSSVWRGILGSPAWAELCITTDLRNMCRLTTQSRIRPFCIRSEGNLPFLEQFQLLTLHFVFGCARVLSRCASCSIFLPFWKASFVFAYERHQSVIAA